MTQNICKGNSEKHDNNTSEFRFLLRHSCD